MSAKTKPTIEDPTPVIEEPTTVEEGETTQFVVFTLADEYYGLDILDVRRILKAEGMTMIPNTPDFLKGVINLRSKIVGVIDIEKRFLLKRDEEHSSKHILIVDMGDNTYGLLVDEVSEIIRLSKNNIKPAPQIITEKLGIDFVKGVGTVGTKLIILLDLEKVLSEKELVELSRISAKTYRTIEPKKKGKEAKKQGISEEKLLKAKPTTKRITTKQKLAEEPTD